jgi:hypothetical protein
MFPWLLELRSTDVNGPSLCWGFSVSTGGALVRTTLGDKVGLASTSRGVFPGKIRNRADFVAEYSAFVLALSSVASAAAEFSCPLHHCGVI